MIDYKKKFFLFKQSKNFCSVPWNQIKVNPDGTITTCVFGRDQLGDASEDINQVLANDVVRSIRSELVNDNMPSNCSVCRQSEKENYEFLRGLYNPMFQSSTVDYDDTSAFKLSAVDLHWSSTCNLKCITCWAKQSSSIAQEQGLPILHTPTEHADKLIDFIVQNQTTLKEIYLSGGEPTLIKHNLRLLKELRKDLKFQIRINTNMMFDDNNLIINELKKFPDVLFTVSADSMHEQFNYIRRGADWNKFITNLTDLHKLHFKWRVNTVFFVATALNLHTTQQYFVDNFGIQDFTINQEAMGHTEIKSRNLSPENKMKCIETLTAHQQTYKHNTNLYSQLETCLNEISLPGQPAYHGYFDDIDKKAGTNWRNVFKDLV